MPRVGIRKLKDRASEILRAVREEGTEYLITRRPPSLDREGNDVERPRSEQPNLPDTKRAQRSYARLRTRVAAWLEHHDVSDQVREYFLLLPDLFALLIRLMRDPRVDRSLKWQLGIVSAYVISPIDLIPDFILPLGLIDDTVALAFVLSRAVRIMGVTGEDVVREHWEGEGDVLMQIQKIAKTADRLLNDRLISRLGRLFR